jgi:GNAT superfamily N-acetyltransferase
MFNSLGDEKLRSAETLTVGVISAPDNDFAAPIQSLLGHKGPEWQFHIKAALRGETDLLETRYYVGFLNGAPVGNVMTLETRGVGILGHVYTRPEHRRKGVCQAIMRHVMDDFRERSGHVLQLGTGFESPPYWIYHSFGFRSLKAGFMRYAGESGDAFEREWFAADTVRAMIMEWRHWPLVALLGAQTGGELLRSAAWRLYGIGNLETPIVRTLSARSDNRGASAVVLETARGAVVGCATLHPTGSGMNGWPGVWIFDFFTHPNFAAHAVEMLHALPLPSGKIIAYVDAGAPDKAAVLEAHGFVREGELSGFLRADGVARDVWLYGKALP